MRQTKIIHPAYADNFRCIGPACEDNCCCQDWRVDVDRAIYEKYQTLPAGPLRTLINASVVPSPEDRMEAGPDNFAQILVSPSHPCPILSAECLCRIQVELGEAYLPKACVQYPRRIHTIDNIVENSPSLSCPEVARLVLLNPSLMETYDPAAHNAVWDDSQKSVHPLRYYFWPLREFSFSLIRNRAYPLWQRIFLLGSFSRRLNAIAHDAKPDGCVPAVLRDFSAAVGSGTLRTSMEAIPANPALQFDFLLRLVLQRLDGVHRNPRLIETLNAFILGVGYGREVTLEGQIEQYAAAYERYFAPFFLKHPYILENYLLHIIFYELFPMGGKLFTPAVIPDPAREFAELTIQFALIKGLLIGVAGHYKETFSTEHVIQTVQTAFKHFEHNRNFMEEAYQLLSAQNLNNVSGLTMLVRN